MGFPELRWVFIAGEPLTSALVQKWRNAFPDAGRVVNLYGPTETTMAKCFYEVPEIPEAGVQPAGAVAADPDPDHGAGRSSAG